MPNDNEIPSNIVYLSGAEPEKDDKQSSEPSPELIEALQDLLAKAQSGELQSFIYGAIFTDRVSTSWVVAQGDTDRTSSAVLHIAYRWGMELHGDAG